MARPRPAIRTQGYTTAGTMPSFASPLQNTLMVLAAALTLLVLMELVVAPLIVRAVSRTGNKLDDKLLERALIRRFSLVGILSLLLLYSRTTVQPHLLDSIWGRLGLELLLVFALAWLVLHLLTLVLVTYRHYDLQKRFPIRGYVQLARMVVLLLAVLLAVALLTGQPVVYYLSGFGAVLAGLLLVFRDTILSLIATVQIHTDRLLAIGDWVEMPEYGIDGSVQEISLHIIKVENWDKTIATVSTRQVVETQMKNWRNMEKGGGRRIKRALHIDLSSIRFLNEEEQGYFSRFRPLRDYMSAKRKEIAAHNASEHSASKQSGQGEVVQLRRLTNIGTFRAYVRSYLQTHPGLHSGGKFTQMVRQLPLGSEGLPLEIYTFTQTTDWVEYEALQADIFDHLLSVMGDFGLRAYQKGLLEGLAQQGVTLYPEVQRPV